MNANSHSYSLMRDLFVNLNVIQIENNILHKMVFWGVRVAHR